MNGDQTVQRAPQSRLTPLTVLFIYLLAGGGWLISRSAARQRSAEEALQSQMEKFRRLVKAVETMQIGVTITDLDRKIIYTNPAEASMHGYTVEELIGRDVRVFSGSAQWTPLNLDQVKEMKKWRRESINVRKDGSRFAVQIMSDVVLNAAGKPIGIVACCEDITERKRVEGALLESKRRVEHILESITDAFFAVDNGWRFTYVNGQAEHFLQRGRSELIGRSLWDELPEIADSVFEENYRKAMADHAAVEFEGCYPPSDTWFQVHAYPSQDGLSVYFQDITERKGTEERIRQMAFYDPLTGLPNRTLFKDRLSQALAQAHRHSRLLAVVFLDLDRFKVINDTLGHAVGDQLLQATAQRLKECCRREVDTVSRRGGDEFIIMLPELDEMRDAVHVAQKIIDSFANPFDIGDHELFVTTSIGISIYPYDGNEVETLVKNADMAMYRAKEQGRNNYQLYTPAMNARAFERLSLEKSLRKALEHEEFLLHYQPRVDTSTGRIVGLEALVRWRHPDLGLVLPAQFIPLADETGLIAPLGEWVMRTACAQNRAWRAQGLPPVHIAVNVSPRQFLLRTLGETVSRALRDNGLEPDSLELEVAESIMLHDMEEVIRTMRRLNAMGVRLSLDNFGSGYSSLGCLKKVPIHALKIDHSFIRAITCNPDDEAITTALIIMARSLKLRVVAEGVETAEQVELLRSLECEEMQGHFFSRPLPAEEIPALLGWEPWEIVPRKRRSL